MAQLAFFYVIVHVIIFFIFVILIGVAVNVDIIVPFNTFADVIIRFNIDFLLLFALNGRDCATNCAAAL